MSYREAEDGYGGDQSIDDYDSRDDDSEVDDYDNRVVDSPIDVRKSSKREDDDDAELATLREVRLFCCSHSDIEGWGLFILQIFSFFVILYFLCVGIVLLASSAQVLGGCYGAQLLADNFDNPISNVMAGIIATSIFQSSTATNLVIGSLAGNYLTVQQCIYMAMGANIGNTIINSFFALVHFKSKTARELAIAGASVNDIFYLLTIAIVLPFEMASKMLYLVSAAAISTYNSTGYGWKGLIEMAVTPVTNKIIITNNEIIPAIISGEIESCKERYPIFCEGGIKSFDTCNPGLLSCDESTGSCPIFFSDDATQKSDLANGAITLAIGLLVILLCLYGMIYLIYRMLMATPVEVIARCSNANSFVSMLGGCGFGLLLGNSSATELILAPFVGMGVIDIEQMFPWSLGSNVGLSLTTIILAISTGNEDFVQVAFANFLFNVIGIIIWFVIPGIRKFPVHGALIVGVLSSAWRAFPLVYVCIVFFGFPFMIIGIIDLMQDSNKGINAAGYITATLLFILSIHGLYWWFNRGGRDKFLNFFDDDDISNQEGHSDESNMDDGVNALPQKKEVTRPSTTPLGILKNYNNNEDITTKAKKIMRNPLRQSRSSDAF